MEKNKKNHKFQKKNENSKNKIHLKMNFFYQHSFSNIISEIIIEDMPKPYHWRYAKNRYFRHIFNDGFWHISNDNF